MYLSASESPTTNTSEQATKEEQRQHDDDAEDKRGQTFSWHEVEETYSFNRWSFMDGVPALCVESAGHHASGRSAGTQRTVYLATPVSLIFGCGGWVQRCAHDCLIQNCSRRHHRTPHTNNPHIRPSSSPSRFTIPLQHINNTINHDPCVYRPARANPHVSCSMLYFPVQNVPRKTFTSSLHLLGKPDNSVNASKIIHTPHKLPIVSTFKAITQTHSRPLHW